MKRNMIITVILLVLLITTYLMNGVSSSLDARTSEEAIAISLIREKISINKILKLDHFHGEKKWWIVWGIDGNDRPFAGWVEGQNVSIDDTTSKPPPSYFSDFVVNQNSLRKIIRVTPGVVHDIKVWEVFYKELTSKGYAYHYAYFKWKNSEPIETYQLAVSK